MLVGDIGHAADAQQIQNSIVRVDGQKSVYLPVLKQGGDSNTISIVNGIKDAIGHLVDVPSNLVANVVFDQSTYVRTAIKNLGNEGGIGLVLTALMILIFLGSMRATLGVMLSIPLSAVAALLVSPLRAGRSTRWCSAGWRWCFRGLSTTRWSCSKISFTIWSRENRRRWQRKRAGRRLLCRCWPLPLRPPSSSFPVVFLYGVSRFLFTALALSVVFALFASYFVAMTVVPLFCARFIKNAHNEAAHHGGGEPVSALCSLVQSPL